MAAGSEAVQFEENPTKTRQGGLINKTRSSPQQMWSTDGGEKDLVWLCVEGLHVDPDQLEIPALCTLKLFLAPPQVLIGQI